MMDMYEVRWDLAGFSDICTWEELTELALRDMSMWHGESRRPRMP
jgi:hypothetical protein